MKTLVIPDLHQPQQLYIDAIEKLIADQKADQVVFLGDYFDRWNDTPNDALRTSGWLACPIWRMLPMCSTIGGDPSHRTII